MIPKEKAKELVESFINALTVKDCALIAVDEIINSSPSLPILGSGGYFYEDIELSSNYYKEVKQEIINL